MRRVSGVSAFDPSEYGAGTLRGWFKADSLSLADGGSVSTWPDSSGNGNDATAGTAPSYKTGIQNGKPGVLFVRASSQHLLSTGLAAVQNGTDLPFTVFVVAQPAAANVTQDVVSWGNAASNTPFSACQYVSTGAITITRRDDAAVSNVGAASSAGTIVAATSYVQTFRFSGTTGTTRQNGVQVSSSAVNVGLTTFTRMGLGCWPRTTITNFYGGYLFEVIVYASALSTTEQQTIERAMGTKWGITVT